MPVPLGTASAGRPSIVVAFGRRPISILLLAAAIAAQLFVGAQAVAEPFRFVVLGDTQDISAAGRAAVARLLKHASGLAPAFTVHIGDLKNGGDPCTDAFIEEAHALLDDLRGALVFTPGDNDWTDCHVRKAGARDPLERLSRLRARFYATGSSLGREPLEFEAVQARQPGFADYVENRRWRRGGIVFATIHQVGSNNNLRPDEAAASEFFARNRANLAWLAEAFHEAKAASAAGVVIFTHANPKWEVGNRSWEPTGFDAFRKALFDHAAEFGRPVLVVHGDTHTFRVDKPLKWGRAFADNVTRLEVFGPSEPGIVVVEVDPGSPGLFRFQPLTLQELGG